MKKTFLYAVTAAIVFMSCHNKSVPTVAERNEHPVVPVAPASPAVSAEILEAGRLVYTTKCSKCHATKPVENWTVDGWQPILKSMIPKAKLDSVQSAQVTAYVKANAKKA